MTQQLATRKLAARWAREDGVAWAIVQESGRVWLWRSDHLRQAMGDDRVGSKAKVFKDFRIIEVVEP